MEQEHCCDCCIVDKKLRSVAIALVRGVSLTHCMVGVSFSTIGSVVFEITSMCDPLLVASFSPRRPNEVC